jgi:drug/metabolite transporter (DMT)-like permease
MSPARANLCLLLCAAIWGGGFIAQSSAMEHIGPFFFIALRFGVATLAMLPLALSEHYRAPSTLEKSDWNMFALIGVILFLGMSSQQAGLLTTSVTNSGFLTGLYLIMVPILGVLLFRQWPHAIVWPCAIAALFGIFLLSGGQLDSLARGDWYTIICAVFWALQILFINRYSNKTGRPITQAVAQFAVTTILAFLCAIAFETLDWASVVLAAPDILFAGIFAGGIAFTLQSVGQRHTTAAKAAIILSSEALFAALFDALINQTRISGLPLVGCVFIFTAMLTVELYPMWRRQIAMREK